MCLILNYVSFTFCFSRVLCQVAWGEGEAPLWGVDGGTNGDDKRRWLALPGANCSSASVRAFATAETHKMGSFFDFLPVPPGMFSEAPPKPKPEGGADTYTPEERAAQADIIKGKSGDHAEGEPTPEAVQQEPPPRSQMQKPLAPIEAGVEECDLCGKKRDASSIAGKSLCPVH